MNLKIQELREKMKNSKLEGMIITNPVSIKYLTNITSPGTLLITRRENVFITNVMFIEQVNTVLTIADEIVVMEDTYLNNDDYENFFVFCENVGFEENHATYGLYKKLMYKYKANSLVETDYIIEKQRAIKNPEEIANIKKACEITDKCFEHLLKFIKIGSTEKEIACEIIRFFNAEANDGIAFEPIVASRKKYFNPTF